LPREVANIKIQRAGASVSEFCIELHPAADLGVRKIGKSKRQCHVGYPSGMAAVFGDELLSSRLLGGGLA